MPATYFGLVVLQPVGFIHHQTGPLYGAQHSLVNGDQLIGCEQDMELDLGFLLEEQRERKAGIREEGTGQPPPSLLLHVTQGERGCTVWHRAHSRAKSRQQNTRTREPSRRLQKLKSSGRNL